jgi:hypothetical protein
MAEEQSEDLGGLEAEGYQIELVPLATGTEASSIVALQQAVKKGARKSWRLVGVAQDPVSQGVLIVWDKSGLVSG